jgi:hypothetical protein
MTQQAIERIPGEINLSAAHFFAYTHKLTSSTEQFHLFTDQLQSSAVYELHLLSF